MFFADSMTLYSTTFLYSQTSVRSTDATFGDARPRINAATGMTFMTAARGIDVLLTQDPFRRMRLPANASIQPVKSLSSKHVTQIKTAA
jgi:hypothetical protein